MELGGFKGKKKTVLAVSELKKTDFQKCDNYQWLKDEIKARQTGYPMWQVCLIILGTPGIVASIVLAFGIRMHVRDYKRFSQYIEFKRQKRTQKNRRQIFSSGAVIGQAILESSDKIFKA